MLEKQGGLLGKTTYFPISESTRTNKMLLLQHSQAAIPHSCPCGRQEICPAESQEKGLLCPALGNGSASSTMAEAPRGGWAKPQRKELDLAKNTSCSLVPVNDRFSEQSHQQVLAFRQHFEIKLALGRRSPSFSLSGLKLISQEQFHYPNPVEKLFHLIYNPSTSSHKAEGSCQTPNTLSIAAIMR